MKKVKAHLEEKDPERVEAFEKAAQNYAKKIVASFKDWEFFTGDKMDPDAMVVLLNYREDGTTPYLVFFKDGLKVEKVVSRPLCYHDTKDSKRLSRNIYFFVCCVVIEVAHVPFNAIVHLQITYSL